jgi:hypothetical protein
MNEEVARLIAADSNVPNSHKLKQQLHLLFQHVTDDQQRSFNHIPNHPNYQLQLRQYSRNKYK